MIAKHTKRTISALNSRQCLCDPVRVLHGFIFIIKNIPGKYHQIRILIINLFHHPLHLPVSQPLPFCAVNSNPRQLQLVEEVRARQSTSVEQLAETLGVTLQTVRRDVKLLADAALLARLDAARRAAERLLVIEPAATDAGSAAVLAALRPVDWVVQADPIGCATLLLQLRPDALGCDAATAASLPAGLKSALLPGEGVR